MKATWEGSISVPVSGQTLSSRNLTRNDGGKFDVTVRINNASGEVVSELVVDTYNPTTTKKLFTLLENAKSGTYHVTFKYNDNGVKRGWLGSLSQNLILSAQVVYSPATSEFITTPSNKDFAIEVAPMEAPTSFDLIPSHSGVQTDFEASPENG